MNNETLITQSYLSFTLGEEMFATDVEKVKEILQLIKITKVPQSPSYMLGVINLRGIVLPVIDTREKFRLPLNEVTENTCIIVLNIEMDNETLLMGALVDSVLEVFELSDDLIKPAPSIGNKYKSEFIKGMVKKEEDFIMLLNMDKVFSSNELLDMKENSSDSVLQ
jgi:purine-binding chemotaxis protein CheW